tara:strand:- start:1247 stop:1504 length:258 start_codon:yes stop_codon:yes gene_type:complete
MDSYFEERKNSKKKYMHNFMFDMVDVIVLRPFGSYDYVFLKYDHASIDTLKDLRNKISWNHLNNLDESFKNNELKAEGGKFREHL